MLLIRLANHNPLLLPHDMGRAVAAGADGVRFVEFYRLPAIDGIAERFFGRLDVGGEGIRG